MSGNDQDRNLPSVGDLTGLAGFAKSLAGPIFAGIGKVSAPYLQRKANEAQIDKFKAWDAALRQRGYAGKTVELTIAEQAEVRLLAEEIQRQDNRERIAVASIESVQHDESDTMEGMSEPDDTWLNQFWHLTERVSDVEMQRFWGMVLARRATNKASCSPRTMAFLATLSGEEAKAIERLAGCVVQIGAGNTAELGVLYSFHHYSSVDEHSPLFEVETRLRNLIRPSYSDTFGPTGFYHQSDFGHSLSFEKIKTNEAFIQIAGKVIKVRFSEELLEDGDLPIGSAFMLTGLGKEVVRLIRPTANNEFLRIVCEGLKLRGFEVADPQSIA